MSEEPKHISELDPTKRAIADQSFREILLAIVVAQGKTVTIPIEHLNAISQTHRLILIVDRAAGVVELTAEKADLVDVTPTQPALTTDPAPLLDSNGNLLKLN